MALYAIVLIGLAIALGLLLIIIIAGLIAERIRRKREGYMLAPTNTMYEKGNMMFNRLPPEDLLGTIRQGRGGPGAPVV